MAPPPARTTTPGRAPMFHTFTDDPLPTCDDTRTTTR